MIYTDDLKITLKFYYLKFSVNLSHNDLFNE